MIRIFRKVADWLAGYERVTCPHCNLHIHFRGVTDAEAKRFRAYVIDHIKQHTTDPRPETP